jgi:YbgC/YbaW family acyl-CoA thioester hydrolase
VPKPSVVEVEARSYELDPYGHLNNAVYVAWLEHGRLCFLRDRGHTYTSVPETFGVRVVVVRTDLSYRAQVRLGDRLFVTTRLARIGRTSFAFAQEIAFADGRRAASGEVTMVAVGPDGAATPLPPGFRSLLEA